MPRGLNGAISAGEAPPRSPFEQHIAHFGNEMRVIDEPGIGAPSGIHRLSGRHGFVIDKQRRAGDCVPQLRESARRSSDKVEMHIRLLEDQLTLMT